MSKNRSRPYVVDELELTPTFDKEPFFVGKPEGGKCMSLKMIAMDLDGTLLDEEKNIAPEDAAAVKDAVAAGYYVTLATGRMYRSALPYAQELRLTHPLVVYNGALIRDPEPERTWASGPCPWMWPSPCWMTCWDGASMSRPMWMTPCGLPGTVRKSGSIPGFPGCLMK